MHIIQPDPHPGRCANLRSSRVTVGKMLRCLDYEGTEHVCRFEVENPLPVATGANTTYVHSRKNEPWKRPW